MCRLRVNTVATCGGDHEFDPVGTAQSAGQTLTPYQPSLLPDLQARLPYAACRRMVRIAAPKPMNVDPTTRLTQRDSAGRVSTPLAREASAA